MCVVRVRQRLEAAGRKRGQTSDAPLGWLRATHIPSISIH